jgi:phosphate butyryltransferase
MGFTQLSNALRAKGARKMAVVAAHERHVLEAVERATHDGVTAPILLGDARLIEKIADEDNLDLSGCSIENLPIDADAAFRAMELVRNKEVDALMKGKIHTGELMKIGLSNGLRRKGRLLSHMVVFEHERLGGRLGVFTDGGLVPFPTVSERAEIVRNAVEAMRALGVPQPKVAVLAPTETPDENIPSSMEAAELVAMNRPGGILEGVGILGGPMDLFSALDPEAAEIKGIKGEVAGKADILLCPDINVGNIMGKALIFFSRNLRIGGCIVGGTVPIVLVSRASSTDDKYCSILIGLTCSGETL